MNTTLVTVVALLVVLAIAFLLKFRGKSEVKFKAPFGTQLEMNGSEPQSRAGIIAKDLASTDGGIKAHDKTGHGIEIEKAKAKKDISLTNESSHEGTRPPKT